MTRILCTPQGPKYHKPSVKQHIQKQQAPVLFNVQSKFNVHMDISQQIKEQRGLSFPISHSKKLSSIYLN
jgi:hypothetical protein